MQFADGLDGKRVLEVGAGSARDSLKLAEMGARSVAVDLSEASLNVAQRGMRKRQVEIDLVRADASRLPFALASFDVVFSQGVLEHFSDPQPFLDEQVRVLRRGGLLLVDVPQTINLYTVRKRLLIRFGKWFAGWETSYSLPELEQLVHSCGLKVVGSYGSGYYPPLLLGLRNLHTFDLRHNLPIRLPARLRTLIEAVWQSLERQRGYYRWMWNIGAVARKVV